MGIVRVFRMFLVAFLMFLALGPLWFVILAGHGVLDILFSGNGDFVRGFSRATEVPALIYWELVKALFTIPLRMIGLGPETKLDEDFELPWILTYQPTGLHMSIFLGVMGVIILFALWAFREGPDIDEEEGDAQPWFWFWASKFSKAGLVIIPIYFLLGGYKGPAISYLIANPLTSGYLVVGGAYSGAMLVWLLVVIWQRKQDKELVKRAQEQQAMRTHLRDVKKVPRTRRRNGNRRSLPQLPPW